MTDLMHSFTSLAPGLAMGTAPSACWQPLSRQPLLILVGVTGVGKSTTEAALLARRPLLQPLPNRRRLTDWLIIGALQQADGAPMTPVVDRAERFDYTRRYRALYPGGMAQALSTLLVDTTQVTRLLLFDGLRGENEIDFAATLLPKAHFIMLDAPDVVRVQRLLRRRDVFDRLTQSALVEFPELEQLFTPAEAATLRSMITGGDVAPDELQAKLRIVEAERRNYDPDATKAALQAHAPSRSLILDTVAFEPAACAAQIETNLIRWGLLPPTEMDHA